MLNRGEIPSFRDSKLAEQPLLPPTIGGLKSHSELYNMGDLLTWEETARRELNDVPELREQRLEQFRTKLKELRSDEFRPLLSADFLMMFLRTRKFDVTRAVKSYQAAFSMHKVDPEVFWPKGKGPLDFRHVLDLPICKVMPKKNTDGTTIIVCTYLYYTIDMFSILDVIAISTMICAHLLRDPYIQTHGVRCVFDYRNLQAKAIRSIPIKYYKVSSRLRSRPEYMKNRADNSRACLKHPRTLVRRSPRVELRVQCRSFRDHLSHCLDSTGRDNRSSRWLPRPPTWFPSCVCTRFPIAHVLRPQTAAEQETGVADSFPFETHRPPSTRQSGSAAGRARRHCGENMSGGIRGRPTRTQ